MDTPSTANDTASMNRSHRSSPREEMRIKWKQLNTPESMASSIAARQVARIGSSKKSQGPPAGCNQPQEPPTSTTPLSSAEGLQDPNSPSTLDEIIESVEAKLTASQRSVELKAEVSDLLSSMRTQLAELDGRCDELVKEKEEETLRIAAIYLKEINDLKANIEELKSKINTASSLPVDEMLHQLAIVDVLLDGYLDTPCD